MRLLWLSNMAPGPVLEKTGRVSRGGLWIDHVLEDLRKQPDLKMQILCRDEQDSAGELDECCSYRTFREQDPIRLSPEQEPAFLECLREFQPDVIHIWGTEYGHTLSMLRACRSMGMLDRAVVSIQGLCSVYARHFNEGIPDRVLHRDTFRDFVRQNNLLQQQEDFRKRGENEREALQLCRNVIGRTKWDRACARLLQPLARYYFCNETLRDPFYQGSWSYGTCVRHRIFASSCVYPIKGFHYLLEALAEVKKRYPDVTVAVPGRNPCAVTLRERMRQDGYAHYLESLIRKNGLEDCIRFLGSLNGEQMKENYLQANVFVLPSTIENSPNSLGEAMLLGVPCAAADVGGVTTMLEPDREGIVYQSTAPYMLADAIEKIFAMEDRAETMGKAAALHARKTHDPEKNLRDLLAIYEKIASGEESR